MNEPLIGMGLRLPAEKGHNLSTNYPAAIYRAGGQAHRRARMLP